MKLVAELAAAARESAVLWQSVPEEARPVN